MILNNNPAIDVDELMKRVRAEAARLRSGGALEFRRGEPRNMNDMQLAKALDRHHAVSTLLSEAEAWNRPVQVPQRLRRFGPLGRFMTRVVNYVFKNQRQAIAAIIHSNREAIWMQHNIGEAVSRNIEDLRSLERYRVESLRDVRMSLDALRSEFAGMALSHHHTREIAERALADGQGALEVLRSEIAGIATAHHVTRGLVEEAMAAGQTSREALEYAGFSRERIDSLESTMREISARLGQAADATAFAHARIETTQSDLRDISARTDSQTKFCHERIDSAESSLRDISARLEYVAGRTEFSHERTDSVESTIRALAAQATGFIERVEHQSKMIAENDRTLHAISDRANDSPTRQEARQSLVDGLREVDRHISERYESTLRAVANLRSEIHAAPALRTPALELDRPVDRNDAVHALLADRFRGTRAEIDAWLAVYLPIMQTCTSISSETPLLDAGPGRGEWLEILRKSDVPALGIETNEILAEECRALGLDVRSGDLLSDLHARPSRSLGALTAFHVVEHLQFEYLLETLRESIRVLAPGGLMILETPDPRNVLVATRTFYLDPTHLHPIPHELLLALVEVVGFVEARVLDLHPPKPVFSAEDRTSLQLNDFFSHSQDYAIIARAPNA